MTEADFEAADVEATQTIDILDFVVAAEIRLSISSSPITSSRKRPAPRPTRCSARLCAAAAAFGVATVVLRQREHLAAVQATGDAMTLTTMRFAHEIAAPAGLNLPADAGLDRREIDLALQLVGTLEGAWQPEKYRDATATRCRRRSSASSRAARRSRRSAGGAARRRSST